MSSIEVPCPGRRGHSTLKPAAAHILATDITDSGDPPNREVQELLDEILGLKMTHIRGEFACS